MITNSTTSVSLGNASVTPNTSTSPSAMQKALVTPISAAARNAPGIDPRPPTTVTTKASAMIARSMPRLAGSRGSCSAPANPARNAPSAKTAVKRRAWSMPSAAVSVRFSAAARISMPKRVRVTSSVNATRTTGAATMRNRSYCGMEWPTISTVPANPGARGPSRSSAPHRYSATSRMMRTTAKVAVSCMSSGASYRRFSRSALDQRADQRDGERRAEQAEPEGKRPATRHARPARCRTCTRSTRRACTASHARNSRRA